MTTYRTGNSVGSNSPLDLYDNSENLDEAINGSAIVWRDRLGRNRTSLTGAVLEMDETVTAAKSEVSSSVAHMEYEASIAVLETRDQASSVLSGLGYLPPISYAQGVVVDSSRFTVTHGDPATTYAANPTALPFTTTADFDSSKWRVVQGLVAADLQQPAGSDLVGIADHMAPQYLKVLSDITNSIPVNFSALWDAKPASSKVNAEDHDYAVKLQDAFDAIRDQRSRSVLELDAGFYGLSARISCRAGVTVRGKGMGKTILYALDDGFPILTLDTEVVSGGVYGASDLTIWCYGDRNQSQASDFQNGVAMGRDGAHRVTFDRVEVAWARTFSMSGRANFGDAFSCYVHDGFRDGINLTDCLVARIIDCDAERLYDDAFAIHGRAVTAEGSSFRRPSIISGCRLTMANGAKVLGAENCVISNLSTRFARGYALVLGYDSVEGLNNPIGNIVTGITALDTLNSALSGQGNALNAMWLIAPTRSKGSATTTLPVLPGEYDPVSKRIVTGDAYAGRWGASLPKLGGRGLILSDIALIQTLNDAAATKFSDFGYGQLWGATGFRDPAFNGSIGTVPNSTQSNGNFSALRFTGDWDGVKISETVQVSGFPTAVRIEGESIRNFEVSANIKRVAVGVDGSTTSGNTVDSDIRVTNASFDLDPFCEASDRERDGNGDLTGRWSTIGGTQFFAANTTRRRGIQFRGCTFRNMKALLSGTNGSYTLISGNTYYVGLDDADSSNGLRGMRSVTRASENRVVHEDSNPTSATFRSLSSPSAVVLEGTSMPTSGYWYAGTRFACQPPVLNSGTGRTITGWRRLRTGGGNALNVDWVAEYVPSTTSG